jgi:GNAT superfamily N-acetyltransferase
MSTTMTTTTAPAARVRRLEPRDKAAWLPLFKGYIEFYKSSVADDVIDETFARLLSGTEGFHIGFVAVDESDAPIGLAHVLFHRSTWSKTWYCYLEDLFVRPDIRAKGIGWSTQEFNYRARGLYDQVATKSPFVQYRR